MRPFLLERARQAAIAIAIVVTLAFTLIHLAPGDPFGAGFDDPNVTPAMRAELRAQFGYDRPLYVQYGRWLVNVARGDFGWSHAMSRPVSDVLREAIPRTLLLVGTSLVFGLAAGIALGTWQAGRAGTAGEQLSGAVALAVLSVPEFLIALGALALLAIRWRVFPATGIVDPVLHDTLAPGGRALDVLRHLALPAATLSLLTAASVSRYQRAALLAVLPEEFVRTARAKGADERTVLVRHALRNALAPVIALGGVLLPMLVGGAVFVEKVFSWPGLGLMTVDAVLGRDYQLVVAAVLVGAVFVAVGSAVADVLAAVVNPRLEQRV